MIAGRRKGDRARALVAVLTAVLLLSALAQVLIGQDQRAEDDLIQRFRIRGQTGSKLISAYLRDLAARETNFAAKRLADAVPDRAAFDAMVASFGFEAAVLLDAEGDLVHVHPQNAELLGKNLASEYDHLARAVAGRPAVSEVVPSAAKGVPVFAIAVPYETPYGRRVVSGAYAIGASPLDEFVKNILPFSAKVYMIDRGSRIAASTAAVPEPFTPLSRYDAPLYQAFRFGSGDTYTQNGRRHFSSVYGITDTSWRLVMSVPEPALFAPLSQVRWVPWFVYSGLVVASTVAIVLLMQLWEREAELRQERSRLRDQLHEELRLNQALDEFAGRVAHDLRNPLANALSATQMATRQSRDSTMLEKWLGIAQGQVRRGIELIHGLLDLAKAAGTPQKEPVDLDALVTEIAGEIEGIQVQKNELPSVEADRLSLRQALANLMENAGRYGRRNGAAKVYVGAELRDDACTITVGDEGPGLDPEEISDVFRPFQRGKTPSVPGTGLGLAIVATAAQAHGGRAWYEPRPGGGALFKISIPQESGRPAR